MRALPSIMLLISCGPIASQSLARDPVSAVLPDQDPRSNTRTATDLRPGMAQMSLKKGRNVVYTAEGGSTLQAVVDRKGAITGYVSVDAAGKVSQLNARPDVPGTLAPGEMALVHECFVITRECLDNPLPRSGNPEDCRLVIPCPKPASFSTLLSQ